MSQATIDPLTPIRLLLEDPHISEIMIDGWQRVYVEKQGQLQDLPTPFHNDAEVLDLINCIVEPLGKVVDEARPFVDARLADGTRFNAVIPPISLTGPLVTLRKMIGRGSITIDRLLEWGCISQAMVDFLRACVLARLNIVVAGGTASGKTTLLHVLARWIPEDERIIVVQTDEFRMDQQRVVNLEPRPADIEGRGAVTLRDLVVNTRLMRPDRVLVTEVNGGEVFDLLSMMSNGHDGTLFSLHANSVRDALARLEVMAQLGSPSFPLLGLRELMASAIQVIMYQERMPDGRRRVIKISEMAGMAEGIIATRDLFEFRRTGRSQGKIDGYFSATGSIPQCLQQVEESAGVRLPLDMFTPQQGRA